MKVDISEKELTAIMAAEFTLRKSREVKNGGIYVENVHDIEHCRRIAFYEADAVLNNFIDILLNKKENS